LSHYPKRGHKPEIKECILNRFKEDGFYLIDLSEVLLSFMVDNLSLQIPSLIQSVKNVADELTNIILIETSVYDLAFSYLQQAFENVINIRIPFPAQGNQKLFYEKYNEALKLAGYAKF
jgi:hypothetical protein